MKIHIRDFALKYLGWDISSFLRSRKPYPGEPSTCLYKMVGDVDGNRIPTYPRFVLYDLDMPIKDNLSKIINESQMIFDSSDFTIINEAFGSVTPNFGQTFTSGKNLKFKGQEYMVVNIQISIADFFNDYSLPQFDYSSEKGLHPIGRFTKVHEGKDVPYNIYVKIDLKRTDEE